MGDFKLFGFIKHSNYQKTILLIATATFVIGIYLKIMHWPGANIMLIFGLLLYLISIIICQNKNLKKFLSFTLPSLVAIIFFIFCYQWIPSWIGRNIFHHFLFWPITVIIPLIIFYFTVFRNIKSLIRIENGSNDMKLIILLLGLILLSWFLINISIPYFNYFVNDLNLFEDYDFN